MARRQAVLTALAVALVVAAPAAGDNSGKLAHVQARLAAARQREAALSSQIASVTSQIREVKKTLESSRGRTQRGPSSNASGERQARRASASGALSQRPKAQS